MANTKYIYKDANYSIDERVTDLINRMTLTEKVAQLDQYMGTNFVDKTYPQKQNIMDFDAKIVWDKFKEVIQDKGIGCIHDLYGTAEINNELQKYAIENTRLGIPILFSEEALHGLLRPGCTIFPQSITLSSTFDEELVYKVARGIAAETRSFNIHETYGPVIDLIRDARWGRVEENFGEDPYLIKRLAVATVKGLQGNDLKNNDSIIAEPKHFAAYGIPVGGLNCAPAQIGERELRSEFLPIFEAAFVEGGAVNTMCSYNSIDGIPCSSNYHLLTEVLREEWDMPGFVRADLGAINRLYHSHHTAEDEKQAIKQAIEAGLDMQYYDFTHEVYQQTIIDMVNSSEISEETVNKAASRVLRVKFMLGLFDNPYIDTTLSKKVVRCKEHQDISLEAACKGICLLKNDGDLLPLRKNIKKIAVIGPNADEPCLGDYTPPIYGFSPTTVLEGISNIVSNDTTIKYVKGVEVIDKLNSIPQEWLFTDDNKNGLCGEYFNNDNFNGEPITTQIDKTIDFNWMLTKPIDELKSHNFSVRWKGKLKPNKNFDGRIGLKCYDSIRLWIDNELVIDRWKNKKDTLQTISFNFNKDKEYNIKIEYLKDASGALILFGYDKGYNEIDKAVSIAKESDVVIAVMGDSQETCGECIDRSELNLPGKQQQLLKELYKTGTPIVLVLQNGRPVTLQWEAENIPSIIEAWYGGDRAGEAIAKVLFGDVNPSGRLSVSFPKHIGQIPVHYNRMPGGSQRYVEGDSEPLFAFGHGLSYTQFTYSDLKIKPQKAAKDEEITISFCVTNNGNKAGDEIAQLYLHDKCSSVVRPVKELKRFKRVTLKPNETKEIKFKMNSDDLKLLNQDYNWVVEPGVFEVMVGKSSSSIELNKNFEIIK